MNPAPLWRALESGESFGLIVLRFFMISGGLVGLFFFATLPLTWPQQAVLGVLMLLIALWLGKSSSSYLVTLTLMMMSMFSTFRYGWFRIGTVITYFSDPGKKVGALDGFFVLILVGAEAYAFIILYLGYMQTAWPLRRAPVPLPDSPDEWPHVDLLIPTYNEPLSVVRYTALASMNIDWPADKLHVYILDDGRRDEFKEFAASAGIGYMTRDDNKHAKAGNINRALKRLTAPYVAIFDCDHVPTRSFLQMTMGWFLRDRNLAMLQTPHHFYSPDPFERNLHQFRTIPNEGELFYGIVQDGNDFWNATFFCGSCAVLRREALDEIGGIAVETVTEDAHTSLRMQMNGWNTAYINIPQAAGLATERLSGHVQQRIRWARGMIQIMRTDNPLFAKGLGFFQRLCYFNAMSHFLYALPRLIFLTAPLIYLLLSHTNVPGYWASLLAYALPHLALAMVTNSRIQGQHRHSFWNEVYETVLSPYILLPTLLALVNPKLGKFNVTAKGGVVNKTFFDVRIAQPFVVLQIFNLLGLLSAIPRFIHIPGFEWIWDGTHPGTIIMNCVWVVLNTIVLGVSTAVAKESQQRREAVRINMVAPGSIRLADGQLIAGETIDASSGGAALRMSEPVALQKGESTRVVFSLHVGDAELPATVVGCEGDILRIRFDSLTIVEEELLTMVLYSRADTWIGWGEARVPDSIGTSFYRIVGLSWLGIRETLMLLIPARKKKNKVNPRLAASGIVPLLLAVALLAPLAAATAHAARTHPSIAAKHAKVTVAVDQPSYGQAAGSFKGEFTLKDIGILQTIELRGIDATHEVFFALPQDEVVKQASIHVIYHFSPSLIANLSHVKVMLNGTLVSTIPAPATPNTGDALLDTTIQLPSMLMVRKNVIAFEFIGHYVLTCEDPANTALWSRIDPNTTISLSGDLLPLVDDLKMLPIPFFDAALTKPPVIPIVFPTTPSKKALQAAGIVASYFGILADYRSTRFPVTVGTVPAGNAVIISENPQNLPAHLNLDTPGGSTVAMRANPNDPYGKVLIVAGADADQLIIAAQAVALRSNLLQGSTVLVTDFTLPKPRVADDAPRWARADQTIELWDYSTAATMQGDGGVPLNTYFRIPPDLYYEDKASVMLMLNYRYNSIPIGPISSMQVKANDTYLGSVPLIPGTEANKVVKTEVSVPVVNLRPFSNSLSFDLTFQLLKKGNCQDTTPINFIGSILRDSFLDLRGFSHWAAMPNLELFANAGFPFTRYADLGQTTVVLPTDPTTSEIELYLTLMGHFGAQTGYPALRVTVADADAMKQGADRDFLVLGTNTDQPGIGKLSNSLPVALNGDSVHVQDEEGFFAPLHHAWWKIKKTDQDTSGEFTVTGMPDSMIEGLESPYAAKRSIVVVSVRNEATFEPLMANFLKAAQSSDISGSVSVLHGSDFQSFRLGNNVYHVGSLPWWTRASLWFMQVPWMVAFAVLFVCFVFAVFTRAWLRRRARIRLEIVEN